MITRNELLKYIDADALADFVQGVAEDAADACIEDGNGTDAERDALIRLAHATIAAHLAGREAALAADVLAAVARYQEGK